MVISAKHAFTSGKVDGPDATLVGANNWNAEHVITMATARLLGRATAAAGAVEEISLAADLAFAGTVLGLEATYKASLVTLTGVQTLTNKTLTSPVLNTPNIVASSLLVGPAAGSNVILELGHQVAGAAFLSIIDFHTGAVVVDYDVRLQASGGTGTAGGGSFAVTAGAFTWGGQSVVNLNAIQTLVNKTLTSPTLTTPTMSAPTITGVSVAPTAAPGTNTTQLATTAFVAAAVAAASPVPATRQIIAGDGMTGGGALSADVTLTMGLPSILTAGSLNAIGTGTHTHAVDVAEITKAGMALIGYSTIGSTNLMRQSAGTARLPGETISGTNINMSSAGGSTAGAISLGTWECKGRIVGDASTNNHDNVTAWTRIA
jgi:hypothetical protein